MRALIAERMVGRTVRSRTITSPATRSHPLESWLAERNADRPITERVLPAACFIRAVALGRSAIATSTAAWVDDHFEPADSVNVAMAISLRRGGLVTPQIEARRRTRSTR
jgi:hypothetical protein